MRFLRVYPGEGRILLWVTAIQVTMSVSSILINNFAQTTFLKRFGVGYLPLVFLLEAVLTFFIANSVGVLMSRFRTLRVFTALLIGFAATGVFFRILLPYNFALIYPALYIIKGMAIGILPILYWDLLTDLFSSQQGKRLYTLITAGGILGTVVGSLLTGKVVRWFGVDNVLVVYAAGMALAAVLNETTELVVKSPIVQRLDSGKRREKRAFREDLREFVSYARRSTLLKMMILLMAIPNAILPLLNYQFNVAVDQYFATEQGTIDFFGWFRGISNAVVFAALMVSSRLVTGWGVGTSLLFHPVNYFISFIGLLLRFDILAAAYARLTTELLKSALNNPARAILYSFFPDRIKGMVRVFLRGNIVRAADFAGSGMLLILTGFLEPRLLSLIAAPLVLVWIFASIKIKRTYGEMLVDSLSQRQSNWKEMGEEDFKAWIRDRKVMENLYNGLRSENPRVALACGEILARARPKGWAAALEAALPGAPPEALPDLLDLLPGEEPPRAPEGLLAVARTAPPALRAEALRTLVRLDPQGSIPILLEMSRGENPSVREEAVVGLWASGDPTARESGKSILEQLLGGEKKDRLVGLRILSRVGPPSFADMLMDAAMTSDPEAKALGLEGLGRMGHPMALELAGDALKSADPVVRRAAAKVLEGRPEGIAHDIWIGLLGDEEEDVRGTASLVLRQRGPEAVNALLKALAVERSRDVRERALAILEDQGLPRAEVSRFALDELEKAYKLISTIRAMEGPSPKRSLGFLLTHLHEQYRYIAEIVLRVLGALDFRDRMGVILRAIRSGNRRDADDAIEALEMSLHKDLRVLLVPLLQESPLDEKISSAKKRFPEIQGLAGLPVRSVLGELMVSDDPVSRLLAMHAWPEMLSNEPIPGELRMKLLSDEDSLVRKEAGILFGPGGADQPVLSGFPERLELTGKVLLFRDLPVSDLVVVTATLSEERYEAGVYVFYEGAPGDSLYLVMEGELSVVKGLGNENEYTLDKMETGSYVGEIALIDRAPRSASIRAETECRLLKMDGHDFNHILMSRPVVIINACKVLTHRIRDLERRLKSA